MSLMHTVMRPIETDIFTVGSVIAAAVSSFFSSGKKFNIQRNTINLSFCFFVESQIRKLILSPCLSLDHNNNI